MSRAVKYTEVFQIKNSFHESRKAWPGDSASESCWGLLRNTSTAPRRARICTASNVIRALLEGYGNRETLREKQTSQKCCNNYRDTRHALLLHKRTVCCTISQTWCTLLSAEYIRISMESIIIQIFFSSRDRANNTFVERRVTPNMSKKQRIRTIKYPYTAGTEAFAEGFNSKKNWYR